MSFGHKYLVVNSLRYPKAFDVTSSQSETASKVILIQNEGLPITDLKVILRVCLRLMPCTGLL